MTFPGRASSGNEPVCMAADHAECSRRSMLLSTLAMASISGTAAGLPVTTAFAGENPSEDGAGRPSSGLPGLPHFPAKAKRVIYLFQSGGPAQMDLLDYKPELRNRHGQEVPKSIYPDDRKTTMSSAQASFPVAASKFDFPRCGESGMRISEVLPHIGKMADDICLINSLHTEAINHDPAITFQQTGSQIPGRPSIGSWLGYGLGTENTDLPAFVAMSSKGSAKNGQPLYDRLWGSGFLPSRHQGVKFRNIGEPVLDIYDPAGVSRAMRRTMLDRLGELNRRQHALVGDPEVESRIAQYELAFRMQMSVPDLLDIEQEPEHVLDMYGPRRPKARQVRLQLPHCTQASRARRPIHPIVPSRLGFA